MRLTVRAAVSAALCAAAVFAGATAAQAGYADVGQRETVCAQTLSVRTAPGGAWLGTLYQGQTFYVREVHGSWVYGFAYGYINHNGWVQNGWFYPLPCSGP
ncbi:MAG TPA: hypothetical protein VFM37_11155 [Pseudonocardiaceae bacterium]|nr:hypothetical protein [Pseudonocardiaceae bacterium]